MPTINKGDFVEVEYTGKVKEEDNELVVLVSWMLADPGMAK